ncbi:ABC transporter ATP-binding protein [Azospirillum sp. RWY-5-1]|uniref:ABC transporter ATP-binding protein n=1 Tax=Azospirillum oleiclasticum TaxID=2735135 RepID=A0ABX2TH97_9PROT|nr:ABC transporter ATP-binding protein [Azospirillum oleiclasticum]NYZ15514.1 ABC transporter ATP-binding protein [Azospirillum oleiclasticum]NYZ22537.1 ABC transporter ATP-binding protein [Azospirillum oleiclasticum]
MTRPPKVLLERVERRFGSSVALAALDLAVEEGEFLTLLGPSGCGKTTTLRIIAGFVDPTGGRVLIDGREVGHLPPNKREVGMVFQNYALFPHLTVAENIAFGMKQRGAPEAVRRRRAGELLDLIKMTGMGDRHPGELSGGQRQRVAIARAVAHPPAILLMDEPLGALDLKLREAMQQELRAIQKALGITTLYVTHDQTEAMVMSDRIVVMQGGRVEQIGTPSDIYMRPASRFVASFVGRINFVPLAADGRPRGGSASPLRLPSGVPIGSRGLTLGLRPEWLRLLPDGAAVNGYNVLDGRVTDSVFVGSHVSLAVDLGDGGTLTVDGRPEDALPAPGQPVRVCWEPERAIILHDH